MDRSPEPERSGVTPRMRALFRVRLTSLGVGLAANVLILTSSVDIVVGVVAFAASVIVYTAISLFLWRCPACGRYPGNAVMPDYCERCGAVIYGLDARVPDRPPAHATDEPRSLRVILAGRALYGVFLLLYFAFQNFVERFAPSFFWPGALILLAGGVWIEWRWWRCPHCGGYLQRRLWPGSTCPKCGGSLRV